MRQGTAGRREHVREAMRAGDDSYLPARDRGPAKALVRDIVDTRHNVATWFLLVAAVVLLSYAAPSPAIKTWSLSLWIVAFLLILIDSVVLGRKIRVLKAQRLPDDNTRGLTWYGVQRATMIRKWRMPKPRLGLGEKF